MTACIREAPVREYCSSFGHCPNSHWTPPHSNGHSVAPIFGQNHANARLYLDISPKNRCPKPSWQGFRPRPPPNGQCPNELLYFLSGATIAGAEFAPSSDLRLSRYLEFFLTSITDIVRLLSHWPKCLFEENKGLKGLFFHSKAQNS